MVPGVTALHGHRSRYLSLRSLRQGQLARRAITTTNPVQEHARTVTLLRDSRFPLTYFFAEHAPRHQRNGIENAVLKEQQMAIRVEPVPFDSEVDAQVAVDFLAGPLGLHVALEYAGDQLLHPVVPVGGPLLAVPVPEMPGGPHAVCCTVVLVAQKPWLALMISCAARS